MTKLHMSSPFYNLDSPDERKEAKQEDSVIIPGLEGLLRKYEKELEKQCYWADEAKNLLETIDNILTPEQINTFLQITIKYEECEEYQNNTAYFISKLIQNSYDAGYNDFVINTKALKEIACLGEVLKGKKSKLIEITIEGNIGVHCGFQAEHSNFEIKGNTGDYCGYTAKNSNFNIKGNAGDRCGWLAEHSNFNIKGNTGYNCGRGSRHSNFTIKGNTGIQCGEYARHSIFDIHGNFGNYISRLSHNCTFITYKENLYERLLKELSHTNGANKTILKDKKGNIIEEKTI